MTVLLWVVVMVGLVAVVAALRLPRPRHRIALAVVVIALALLFWPVECATSTGSARESASEDSSRTSCTSVVGLRLPIEAGLGIVLGGAALLAITGAVQRRRRAHDDRSS